MVVRGGGLEVPGAHLLLDPGVVPGDLAHVPVSDEVEPAVANVRDVQRLPDDRPRDERRRAPVGLGGGVDGGVRLLDGVAERGRRVRLRVGVVLPNDRLDAEPRGDLARGLAADAVGDDVETPPRRPIRRW